MTEVTTVQLKADFPNVLELTKYEPVKINKYGKNCAVLLSNDEYERLQKIEDELLEIKIAEVKKEGFLSLEESENCLKDMLNA